MQRPSDVAALSWGGADHRNRQPGAGRIVPFAAASGLREGECLRLRSGDIDFERGTVRVRESKTRSGVRVVDLPPIALRLLREQLLARPPGTELVFPGPAGKLLDRHRLMGRYFRPAAVRAGLGAVDVDRHYTGVVFHDLRHTFVSLMAAAGVHVSVIASIVGHKDGAGCSPPLPAPLPDGTEGGRGGLRASRAERRGRTGVANARPALSVAGQST